MNRTQRYKILERDAFRCVYCGATAEESRLEVDHVIPRSKGGTDNPHNLVTACFDCNRGKRDHACRNGVAPAFERWRDAEYVLMCHVTGDELPRTQPRRQAPIDPTIPLGRYTPMSPGDVAQIAECF